jgi:hypothetical protein
MEEFRTLARAGAVDLPGAMWDLQPGATWLHLPIPKFSPVRAAASANIAQAALDLSDGRTADAERRLREVVSVGILLVDNGHTLMENLVGATMVSSARTALQAFYEVTGRDRDARFISPQNDPEPPSSLGEVRAANLEEFNRSIAALVQDSTALPGLRWEMLQMFLAMQPCTDLHQVMFGPDSLHVATLAAARRTMVKLASDSAIFAMAESHTVMPIVARGSRGAAVRSTLPVTRALAAMTGSRQLESCLSLFGGS